MKYVLPAIGTMVLIFLGAMFLGGMFTLGNIASQPGRVLTKTFDADNMIANYEWFRQQYADIQAMNTRIENTTGAIALATDTKEKTRLGQVLLGLQNQLASMREAYNGRASMTNRNIFMNPPVVGGPILPERV